MRTVVTETLGTDSTALVADIRPAGSGSFPSKGVTINGSSFFTANDGIHGTELWKSDGSTTGTMLLKDIRVGSSGSNPSNLTAMNGLVFFTANDGITGSELWKSDGTTAGTVLVKDIRPGSSSAILFQTLTALNGTLFFSANDGTNGEELWKSDGTATGTVLVKDIRPGNAGANPSNLTAVNATLFFAANDGTNGTELWRSDGTATGTVLVKDILAGASGSSPQYLTAVNGTLFFAADDGMNGTELWKSDGTASGTELVKDILLGASGSSPAFLTALNDTLFLSAYTSASGQELWKSDGTAAGTLLVKDIQPGSASASPSSLTAVNGRVFFRASDGLHGVELWKSDGSADGTVLLKDIGPGSASGNLLYLTAANGRLFFSADDGTHGNELWTSDGTATGTTLAQDIVVGSGGSNPTNLSASAGRLFFAANDGTHGQELWLHIDGHRGVYYTYDGLSRLTSAVESSDATYGYGYDLAGNRTDVWQNGVLAAHHDYDAADQVVGWSYDAAGNLTGDGTTSYAYDARNRLVQRESTSNSYNGDGVLVSDGATRYTQDLAALLSQVLQTTQGLTTTDYLYGRERLAALNANAKTWYVGDALGSVRLTLDDAGAPLGGVNYDPWGTVESGNVPMFGFTGEVQDAAAGLVYLRARWYDTMLGRFGARDPFAGVMAEPQTLAPYSYADNNPINTVDPSGKLAIFIGGLGSENYGADPFNTHHMVGVWEMGRRFANGPAPVIQKGATIIASWTALTPITTSLEKFTNICKTEPIILIGHSLGAATSVDAAAFANRVEIDLLVTMDIISPYYDTGIWIKPHNVKRQINFLSELSINNKGGDIAVRNVVGAENITIPGSVHTTIDNEFLDETRTIPNPAWSEIEEAIHEVMQLYK